MLNTYVNTFNTRMHSSGMRTLRCSGRPWRRGGWVSAQGVSACQPPPVDRMTYKYLAATISRTERKFLHQSIIVSIVVSIPACHAGDRGSIPRRGDQIIRNNTVYFCNSSFWCWLKSICWVTQMQKNKNKQERSLKLFHIFTIITHWK